MDGNQYSARLAEIEAAIDRIVPVDPERAWFRSVAGSVSDADRAVDTHRGGRDLPREDALGVILRPLRELLGRGGKRWRPLLSLAVNDLVGASADALSLGVLVELAHTGSLIVDDIEDGAEWRRGAPSIHVLFGVDTAINSGNFLYVLPAVLIDTLPSSPERKLSYYRMYFEDMRRLHVGQGLDIQWHRDRSHRPARGEYLQMCRLKTGSLARLAARLGAAAGGAAQETIDFLGALFEDVGVAFQILDDVRNLTTGNPGKRRGDDIVEGKKSLPVIIASEDNAERSSRLNACFERAGRDGIESPAVEDAIAELEACGSIRAAADIAVGMVRASEEALRAKFTDTIGLRNLLVLLGDLAG